MNAAVEAKHGVYTQIPRKWLKFTSCCENAKMASASAWKQNVENPRSRPRLRSRNSLRKLPNDHVDLVYSSTGRKKWTEHQGKERELSNNEHVNQRREDKAGRRVGQGRLTIGDPFRAGQILVCVQLGWMGPTSTRRKIQHSEFKIWRTEAQKEGDNFIQPFNPHTHTVDGRKLWWLELSQQLCLSLQARADVCSIFSIQLIELVIIINVDWCLGFCDLITARDLPDKRETSRLWLKKLSLYLFPEVEHVSPGIINNSHVSDHDVTSINNRDVSSRWQT